jgi:flagellar motility protein MotE (MotC chaperone)
MNRLGPLLLSLLCLLPLPAQGEDPASPPPATSNQEQEFGSVEERRLFATLQEERGNLAKEREALEEKKKELKRLEGEVDKKLDELNQLRTRVEKSLAEKDAQEVKRIQDLGKMYEKMAPEKAASIFATLDQDLAIALLAQMKTKSAAKILNSMEKEKAAKLTTAFSNTEDR